MTRRPLGQAKEAPALQDPSGGMVAPGRIADRFRAGSAFGAGDLGERAHPQPRERRHEGTRGGGVWITQVGLRPFGFGPGGPTLPPSNVGCGGFERRTMGSGQHERNPFGLRQCRFGHELTWRDPAHLSIGCSVQDPTSQPRHRPGCGKRRSSQLALRGLSRGLSPGRARRTLRGRHQSDSERPHKGGPRRRLFGGPLDDGPRDWAPSWHHPSTGSPPGDFQLPYRFLLIRGASEGGRIGAACGRRRGLSVLGLGVRGRRDGARYQRHDQRG